MKRWKGCRKTLPDRGKRLQSSRARDLAKGLEPQSEGVFGRVDPYLSRGAVREPVLVKLERTPEIFQRGGRSGVTTGRQRRCVTRDNTWEENAHQRGDHTST